MNTAPLATQRLARIAQARRLAMQDASPAAATLVEPWIVQSWQRCLAQGRRPQERIAFDVVSAAAMRRTAEANRLLVQAARPVLQQLAQALAQTRYFAILTNHEGVVIDSDGPIDRQDRRASVITRVGVDLSEPAVGTTAIGAALRELQPVWLHRGEHFFDDTAVYSCAGAPLLGPDGRCVGMLDLTGVEAAERPELRHLAAQAAQRIENALLLQLPHQLVLRLRWPGLLPGPDGEGLLTLDEDGCVVAANRAARDMLPLLRQPQPGLHGRDLFAMPWPHLFDAARHGQPLAVPLWSGLRLQVQAHLAGGGSAAVQATAPAAAARTPLRDIETRLIRQAVAEARGNVAQAARTLGISRATVYRRLAQRRDEPDTAP
jgi:transcriptional regulator of acetoin/glycerol metabolism